MKIYIASSWKNQHAVEMLTALLRDLDHHVLSFVENNHGEGHSAEKSIPFEEWVLTAEADRSFAYDTTGATTSDIVIYISPSGKDAAAEVGMAWAKGIPIIGLSAKGEDFGLMRKMMTAWVHHYQDVLALVQDHQWAKNFEKHFIKKQNELFFKWADEYFLNKLNEFIPRQEAFTAWKTSGNNISTPQSFIQRLQLWADHQGHVLNPAGLKYGSRYILKKIDGKVTECIFLATNREEVSA